MGGDLLIGKLVLRAVLRGVHLLIWVQRCFGGVDQLIDKLGVGALLWVGRAP